MFSPVASSWVNGRPISSVNLAASESMSVISCAGSGLVRRTTPVSASIGPPSGTRDSRGGSGLKGTNPVASRSSESAISEVITSWKPGMSRGYSKVMKPTADRCKSLKIGRFFDDQSLSQNFGELNRTLNVRLQFGWLDVDKVACDLQGRQKSSRVPYHVSVYLLSLSSHFVVPSVACLRSSEILSSFRPST
jgi:hypothetical protein